MDPRVYHWDTLFVKGKEMWRHAGHRPDALRQLKQIHKGDRALAYHGKPEHAIYALAEVSRDPYPDPHENDTKKMVMDLRAIERLPRQVTLAELRENTIAAQDQIPQKYAHDHLPADRRRVSGNPAHGRYRRFARHSASVGITPSAIAF